MKRLAVVLIFVMMISACGNQEQTGSKLNPEKLPPNTVKIPSDPNNLGNRLKLQVDFKNDSLNFDIPMEGIKNILSSFNFVDPTEGAGLKESILVQGDYEYVYREDPGNGVFGWGKVYKIQEDAKYLASAAYYWGAMGYKGESKDLLGYKIHHDPIISVSTEVVSRNLNWVSITITQEDTEVFLQFWDPDQYSENNPDYYLTRFRYSLDGGKTVHHYTYNKDGSFKESYEKAY